MSDDELPTIQTDDVDAYRVRGYALVDVRTDAEWADGHIDGAIHVPLDQVVQRIAEIPEPAALICARGGRSAQATAYLLGQGRTAVNVAGGMHAWSEAGRPVAQ